MAYISIHFLIPISKYFLNKDVSMETCKKRKFGDYLNGITFGTKS